MKKLTTLTLILALASAGAAFADKPQKNEKGREAKEKDKGGKVQLTVTFGDTDRAAARSYFASKYGKNNCPPGLAKKNNGCLPPGQAKKRYQVGERLSRDVVYVEAPAELIVKLSPAPAGHKYVMVDGDLIKLAVGTLLVVDAIDGLIN